MPYSETRVKHLEMIQAVIARLSGNSFAIKGLAVTVASAAAGLAAAEKVSAPLLYATAPTLIFWMLDAYYMRLEHQFRALFNTVRRGGGETDFDLDSSPYRNAVGPVVRRALSPSLWGLYLPIIGFLLLAWWAL